MDFIIFFHLRDCKNYLLIEHLQQCSGICSVKRKRRTDDLLDKILVDLNACPDYLVVNQGDSRWHNVECNSFLKLYEWGKYLSRELNTCFVQTIYCWVNDYTYLLVYENGIKRREIEGTGASPVPVINEGVLFPFEQSGKDGKRANGLRMFDLDSLAGFCHQLGIDLTCLQRKRDSIVLDAGGKQPAMYNVAREMKQRLWKLEKNNRLKGVVIGKARKWKANE